MTKKFFAALAALFIVCGVTTASAQLKFGVVAGANMSTLTFDKSKYMDSNERVGWYIGPKVWFQLPVVGLGINASAQYSQRRLNAGVDLGAVEASKSETYKSIEVPINIRYGIGLGSVASVFAETGPQFGFNVGNRVVNEMCKFESSNVTWNVGVGARILGKVEVGVGYNFAVSQFGKVYVPQVMNNKFKSNTWQGQVAYLF